MKNTFFPFFLPIFGTLGPPPPLPGVRRTSFRECRPDPHLPPGGWAVKEARAEQPLHYGGQEGARLRPPPHSNSSVRPRGFPRLFSPVPGTRRVSCGLLQVRFSDQVTLVASLDNRRGAPRYLHLSPSRCAPPFDPEPTRKGFRQPPSPHLWMPQCYVGLSAPLGSSPGRRPQPSREPCLTLLPAPDVRARIYRVGNKKRPGNHSCLMLLIML